MENGFSFAGMSTRDFNMLVEHYPKQGSPKRKRTSISVPGRNGDLHYDEGAFENYKQSYSCGFCDYRPTAELAHAIKCWLFSPRGYQRLEDGYDTAHFRMASFAGPLDIENQLNKIGKCTVTFDCAPQYFLKCGERPILLDTPSSLYNAWFPAQPIVYVYGSGDGTMTVGSVTVQLFGLSGSITLDCEMQNAYRVTGGVMENLNAHIRAPEFPTLAHGDNPITWSGGVERAEIIPRWWEL